MATDSPNNKPGGLPDKKPGDRLSAEHINALNAAGRLAISLGLGTGGTTKTAGGQLSTQPTPQIHIIRIEAVIDAVNGRYTCRMRWPDLSTGKWWPDLSDIYDLDCYDYLTSNPGFSNLQPLDILSAWWHPARQMFVPTSSLGTGIVRLGKIYGPASGLKPGGSCDVVFETVTLPPANPLASSDSSNHVKAYDWNGIPLGKGTQVTVFQDQKSKLWFVLSGNPLAETINFMLEATLATTDATVSSFTITRYNRGTNPQANGATVVINNAAASTNYMFSGANGHLGKAELISTDPANPVYEIYQMECP